nr:hypothetical protein [uncultured Pseudomonas sp.]
MKEEIIQLIANSNSTQEALHLYRMFKSMLPNCKFVFAAKHGAAPGLSINHEFSAGAVVRSLFHTPKVLVLDEQTIEEMDSGRATFPIDYSISLDTQALSYLEPYMGGNTSRLPKDFEEVFKFIAADNVFVDPLPYTLENMKNLSNPEKAENIFKKIKSYEILRDIDAEMLAARGVVNSKLTDGEIEKKAQESMARMYMNLDDDNFMGTLSSRHRFMYCQLLKMAVINLRNDLGTPFLKTRCFLDFCDQSLGSMGAREMAVAKEYFSRGQEFRFFGKIQKNKKDILKILDGMAWDLWHVRQLEQNMTITLDSRARYFFPSLLTFDKRFVEVMDLYPLKSLAYIDGSSEPMPFYDGNLLSFLADGELEQEKEIENRYYSINAKESRAARRVACQETIELIIESLEGELKQIVPSIEPL